MTKPPPSPCSTRNAISDSTFHDAATRPDPIVKTPIAVRNTWRAPNRLIAQAAAGMTVARASV